MIKSLIKKNNMGPPYNWHPLTQSCIVLDKYYTLPVVFLWQFTNIRFHQLGNFFIFYMSQFTFFINLFYTFSHNMLIGFLTNKATCKKRLEVSFDFVFSPFHKCGLFRLRKYFRIATSCIGVCNSILNRICCASGGSISFFSFVTEVHIALKIENGYIKEWHPLLPSNL